ncbi:hypothetical protein V496_04205 [Pseudogymnoascus sp. VKM F-4515 (FW-2607)]|nr:hypothetical protein V496_04205 [Pseudogymnoascus sp. VKM F-4515 (FW-2607)]
MDSMRGWFLTSRASSPTKDQNITNFSATSSNPLQPTTTKLSKQHASSHINQRPPSRGPRDIPRCTILAVPSAWHRTDAHALLVLQMEMKSGSSAERSAETVAQNVAKQQGLLHRTIMSFERMDTADL